MFYEAGHDLNITLEHGKILSLKPLKNFKYKTSAELLISKLVCDINTLKHNDTFMKKEDDIPGISNNAVRSY